MLLPGGMGFRNEGRYSRGRTVFRKVRKDMRGNIFWMAAVSCIAAGNIFLLHAETLGGKYPGFWHTGINQDINRAISQNHIHGCGEYKFKQNKDTPEEFLIYCTTDRTHWKAYVVSTRENKVMGPYNVEAFSE